MNYFMRPASEGPLFQSFFIGGFECSTHRTRSGRRLDMLAATGHDSCAAADFARLQAYGIHTARSGVRWHLIEPTPDHYNFSSVFPILNAARSAGIQVIWDLCHFGWPDDIDIFSPEFIRRFARMARGFVSMLMNETDDIPFVAPINEISYFAWAGGDVGYFYPFLQGRAQELKAQLVRATIEAMEAIRDVAPKTRFVQTEPVINVIAHPERQHEEPDAEGFRQLQYQAWDMLCGRLFPYLGGDEKYLDIIGVNFYPQNQWIYDGPPASRKPLSMLSLEASDRPLKSSEPSYYSYSYSSIRSDQSSRFIDRRNRLYRHFRYILQEVYERYGRQMFIAETGAEDEERPSWLSYVCREVRAAIRRGIPIEGICLYPIVNYPGWDDDRHCHNGLWDYPPGEKCERDIYEPLAHELNRQRHYIEQSFSDTPDIICLSHLRWYSVFQRPHHLMSRCAKKYRVFFIEEPIFGEGPAQLKISRCGKSGVWVIVPHLSNGISRDVINSTREELINSLFAEYDIGSYVLWYYTPMAISFTRYLKPLLVIYDCMDELSAFRGAPSDIGEREAELFDCADLVFTGGQSLYEFKRNRYPDIYLFLSSVDVAHFAQARGITEDPIDQAYIPHPRIGFYGVIDERLDITLLESVAKVRPDWHFLMIGPVVKIDPAILPRCANIHYLGSKPYEDLPKYIAGWDIAMLPFARNEATRFISPTKTPEYLAAGKPVISTSIHDIVFLYGQQGLALIADTAEQFISAVEAIINKDPYKSEWLQQVDLFLAQNSWDRTWTQMMQIIFRTVEQNFNSFARRYAPRK